MSIPDSFSKATEPGGVGRTTTCLFIGGSADGQRISVPDYMTWFRVTNGKYDEEQDRVIDYDEYRREQLASPLRRYVVFIENSLTLDVALRLLINCYRPQTDFVTLPEK